MTTAAKAQSNARQWAILPRQTIDAELDTETVLKSIVNACVTNVAAFDETGKLLCVSGTWLSFAQLNGLTADNAYGLNNLRTCRQSVGGIRAKQVGFRESIQRIIDGKQIEFQEEFVLRTSATPRWFLTRAASIEMPGGVRILASLEDITRPRQAEEELRNIGGRLINAQEEERTRIARELHDDLSQRLALLSLEVDRMRPQILTDQHDLQNAVERLSQGIRELNTDIHRLSYQLHPFRLDYLSLSEAIKGLCEDLSAHQDLQIRFRQQGFPAVLPEEVTLCVFRIAQESLHNMVKHSGATKGEVVVSTTANAVRLLVSDDGCGFDIELAKRKKRLGLLSMRERLRLVEGKISIRSQPHQGTKIDVFIPLTLGCPAPSKVSPIAFMSNRLPD